MAEIWEFENELENKANRYFKYSTLFAIPITLYMTFFISSVLFGTNLQFFYNLIEYSPFLHLVPMILFGWPAAIFANKYRQLKAGIVGEATTVKYLQGLPDDYHIYKNFRFSYEGRPYECDNIIVGENGIFIIEVKSNTGTIRGGANDYKWEQDKVSRRGRDYHKEMRNPVKQVKGQVYALAKFLKEHKMNVWVQGIVFFAAAERLILSGLEDFPVFLDSDDLIEYIEEYKPRQKIKSEDIEKINNRFLNW